MNSKPITMPAYVEDHVAFLDDTVKPAPVTHKPFTTFNKKAVDATVQPMFFGENVNVARYDQQKYSIFEKLSEKQLSYFWRPEEVELTQDKKDFNDMSPHEQHIFISNLKYQTLLDSVQGRSPTIAFLPIVSLPELENWIENWSFSECLAEGTEVLTTNGWRDLADVTTDDACLVYDLDTCSVFFEKPKRVVEYDMDTQLIEYVSDNPRQFNQLVTPNHRMPVVLRSDLSEDKRTRFFKEAMYQDYAPHHLAPISGVLKSVVGERTITAFERLLIAIQADGTVSTRYNGKRVGTVPAWFTFAKTRKIDRLTEICREGGFELTELTPAKRNGNRRFKVAVPTSELGDINPKLLTWVNFGEVTYEWCKEFLYELSMWDAHRQNDDRDGSFTYVTTVRENSDVVQAVASLCGKSPRLTVRQDNRKETYSDTYAINVVDRKFKDGQSIQRRYVPYKGKVRCLETSTGAFLIRYNGVVSVTGNTIHSRSYTHIMRNVFNDPSAILDEIMLTPEIIKRASAVTEEYDTFIELTNVYSVIGHFGQHTVNGITYDCSEYNMKYRLARTMVSVYALEAIRFYVSFACTFSFAERGIMEGNAKIVRFICRDELLHKTGTKHILSLLVGSRENDPVMQEIFKTHHDEFKQILVDCKDQESEWIEYLFKDGSMIGLNARILNEYLEWVTDEASDNLGWGPIVGQLKSNPLPWMRSWVTSDAVQPAPQETELSSYLVGQIDSSVDVDSLGNFEDGFDF